MSAKFRRIDKAVSIYFDTTRDVKKHPEELILASTVYMWDGRSPLQKYMRNHFKNDSTATELKRWATFGPLYSAYGSYLIRHYPFLFTKYYICNNAQKFYTPPVKFLQQYSIGVDSVNIMAQVWFGYKSRKISSRFKDFNVIVLDFLPALPVWSFFLDCWHTCY